MDETKRQATSSRGPASARVRVVPAVLAIGGFELTAFGLVALVAQPRAGLLAFAAVLELQLFLLAVVALVVGAIVWRSRIVAATLITVLLFTGARFGSELVSVPGSGTADFVVLTWNLERGARTGQEAVDALRASKGDVVALQELEPAIAQTIASDAELRSRFPYQFLEPRDDVLGLGVLSRYPIADGRVRYDPAVLELTIKAPQGDLTMIDAHPLPLLVRMGSGHLPLSFDPADRDAQIQTIRGRIDEALSARQALLVLGDFNTSPSEPGYQALAGGLRDAQVEVGQGPGWTWRPPRFDFLPVAFVRLDLQLSAGALQPVSIQIDCSYPGDHCQVLAGYAWV